MVGRGVKTYFVSYGRVEEGFAELRHRFAPSDNVDDLIDEVFEFCRTGMLWDELVAFVAETEKAAYNGLATEWGWPVKE